MSSLTGMRSALAFLTPAGGARIAAAAPDHRAIAWFAPVGALVGLAVGATWWVAGEIWAPAVAAAIAVVADLALTGMLHIDGVADSADGLLPHLDRRRRLDVMSAPDIGAFGVAAAGSTLLLRFACLASIEPDPLLLAGIWAASRAVAAFVLATQPYARESGLASAFAGGSAIAPVLGFAAALLLGGWAVFGALGGVAVVVLARRRVGGYTGDVLGAAIVTGETVALLAGAAG